MIAAISRLTTDYVDTEDRLRLSGEIANGPPISLWLTQRLALRLLPEFLKWLDGQVGATPAQASAASATGARDAHKEIVHGFAQEAAMAELKPQDRVQAGTASASLIKTVELKPDEQRIVVIFKTADGQASGFGLTAPELRQWLAIVQNVWLHAGWSDAPWPEWMKSEAQPVERQIVLH